MNRQGFSLYLTFLISTVIFLLVTTSYEISKTALDLGRSEAIETQVFQHRKLPIQEARLFRREGHVDGMQKRLSRHLIFRVLSHQFLK